MKLFGVIARLAILLLLILLPVGGGGGLRRHTSSVDAGGWRVVARLVGPGGHHR